MKTSVSEVQKYLTAVKYPANKEQIVSVAMEAEAPEDVMDELNEVASQKYDSPADLMKELGS